MPKQSFALEAGGPKRLHIAWSGMYRNVTVSLDEAPVGVIPDQKALARGQELALPDGSVLKVQLVNTVVSSELRVLHNGQPLPGSASDPHARLRNAYLMVYIVGCLNVVLGLAATLLKVELLQQVGVGFSSILFGLMFLGLGFFVQRRSAFALIVAIVLFAIDGLAGMALVAASGMTPSIGGLFARLILLIPMVQGLSAIRALKAVSKPPARPIAAS